jgi:Zn-dependent peptidase ImmA (M78 family)
MASVRAKVKAELLEWARVTAGFTVEDAAKKAAVDPGRVAAWEDPHGEDRPTMNQLRMLAKSYRQPLSVFYLSKPPRGAPIMHDFRRLPGEVAQVYSPSLRLEIMSAYRRRTVALSLLEELGMAAPKFTHRVSLADGPEIAGAKARDVLGVNYELARQWRDDRKAYNGWRRAIEGTGVLVFQAVGVGVGEMRGFSIAEDTLPVIAVNKKDRVHGRIFSLLHEFIHLLLHESGLCDFDEDALRPPAESRIEIFCNHAAGAALVPRDELLREPIVVGRGEGNHHLWSDEELTALGRIYGVSREVVLRRLLILGRASQAYYGARHVAFMSQYKREEEEKPPPEKFMRNMPQEAVSNYGEAFTNLVVDTYHQDRIPLSDAAQYLGVRAKHLPRVERLLRGEGTAPPL